MDLDRSPPGSASKAVVSSDSSVATTAAETNEADSGEGNPGDEWWDEPYDSTGHWGSEDWGLSSWGNNPLDQSELASFGEKLREAPSMDPSCEGGQGREEFEKPGSQEAWEEDWSAEPSSGEKLGKAPSMDPSCEGGQGWEEFEKPGSQEAWEEDWSSEPASGEKLGKAPSMDPAREEGQGWGEFEEPGEAWEEDGFGNNPLTSWVENVENSPSMGPFWEEGPGWEKFEEPASQEAWEEELWDQGWEGESITPDVPGMSHGWEPDWGHVVALFDESFTSVTVESLRQGIDHLTKKELSDRIYDAQLHPRFPSWAAHMRSIWDRDDPTEPYTFGCTDVIEELLGFECWAKAWEDAAAKAGSPPSSKDGATKEDDLLRQRTLKLGEEEDDSGDAMVSTDMSGNVKAPMETQDGH